MRKQILGVNIDYGLSMEDVLKTADSLIKEKKSTHLIATTSPYFVMSAQKDDEFKAIVNDAVLSVPDGVGTLYARYYYNKLEGVNKGVLYPFKALFTGFQTALAGIFDARGLGTTITGVDLTMELFKLAEKNEYNVFLLGGKKRDGKGNLMTKDEYDMATDTKRVIEAIHPNIRIIGATSDFNKGQEDDAKTLDYMHQCMKKANISKIDILLVAYNPVSQEKWIKRNAKGIPATLSVGIGRTFDYLTETMCKPPKILEKLHLAWTYAFIKQPWRFKRVFMTFPLFPLRVFLDSLKSS